jgi:hypothetical protein
MLKFMGLYWPQGWKKDTVKLNLGDQFATLGTNVPAFIGLAYQGTDIVFRFRV